jgi:hypothetical protein
MILMMLITSCAIENPTPYPTESPTPTVNPITESITIVNITNINRVFWLSGNQKSVITNSSSITFVGVPDGTYEYEILNNGVGNFSNLKVDGADRTQMVSLPYHR